MTTYQSIVFVQGDEAGEPLDLLDRDGAAAAVAYLAQWDTGEANGEPCKESSAGTSDSQERCGAYLLTWNNRLGYIGLERVHD